MDFIFLEYDIEWMLRVKYLMSDNLHTALWDDSKLCVASFYNFARKKNNAKIDAALLL